MLLRLRDEDTLVGPVLIFWVMPPGARSARERMGLRDTFGSEGASGVLEALMASTRGAWCAHIVASLEFAPH